MDTIPVRLSIYIFCADFLGPVITGIWDDSYITLSAFYDLNFKAFLVRGI
jgi:hypothetical protein